MTADTLVRVHMLRDRGVDRKGDVVWMTAAEATQVIADGVAEASPDEPQPARQPPSGVVVQAERPLADKAIHPEDLTHK